MTTTAISEKPEASPIRAPRLTFACPDCGEPCQRKGLRAYQNVGGTIVRYHCNGLQGCRKYHMRDPKTLVVVTPQEASAVVRQHPATHRPSVDPVLSLASKVGAAPAEATGSDKGRPRLIVRVLEEDEIAALPPGQAQQARQAQTWLLQSAGILNTIRRESRNLKAL